MRVYIVGNTEIEFLPDEPPFKIFGTYDEAWTEAESNINLHVGDAELDISSIEDAKSEFRKESDSLYREADDYAATYNRGVWTGLCLALKLLKSDYKESNDMDNQSINKIYNRYLESRNR